MKIYGSAILNQASSKFSVDFDGEKEISTNELYLLAYADLTWEGIGIHEDECSFVVITTKHKIDVKGAEVETSKGFETIHEFQMYLRGQIRVNEYPEMEQIESEEIRLKNGYVEYMDLFSVSKESRIKAIGEKYTVNATVPERTKGSVKMLEEYRGYEEGYCSDWTDGEIKVYFFLSGLALEETITENKG